MPALLRVTASAQQGECERENGETEGERNARRSTLFFHPQPHLSNPARPSPPASSRRAALLGGAASAAAVLFTTRPALASIPDPGCELTKLPSGLAWCDTKAGTGPPANPAAPVRAHYTGRLASNGAVFDSSFERGKPLTFSKGQVIQGWNIGVWGDDEGSLPPMKEGGVRRLVIPAELGYGARGAGGVIPPGAELVFDVTLLGPRKRG